MLEELNDKQKEAVLYNDGPLLIIAGAGAGKTKTLTTKIAYLIDHEKVSPYNILAITFTNKAAKEMKDRLFSLIGDVTKKIQVSTFHSFGLRLIRENYNYLGYDKNFNIMDSDDSLTIVKKILKEQNLDSKIYNPKAIRNKISSLKNDLITPEKYKAYAVSDYEEVVCNIYKKYNELLFNNNSLDFDDLLIQPIRLFKENKEVLEKYQELFKYVLIDEYQDTNEAQYILTKMICKKYRNITTVGDDSQSIYSFRGANFKNILNFEKDYPDAKLVLLEENYRSTSTILDAANSLIKNNINKKDKNLWTNRGKGEKIKYFRAFNERDEAFFVIRKVKELIDKGIELKDIAVLYRTNAQSRIIEEEFLKENIAYRVVGSFYFYARKEIKDLIAYLKLINNPKDNISFLRVINTPKRGIGLKSIEKLTNYANENNLSLFEAITDDKKQLEFKNLILKLQEVSKNITLTELIDKVLDSTGIKEELESEETLEADIRLENLEEFKSITKSFEEQEGLISLEDFLYEISLVSDVEEYKDDPNRVSLMTIHSVKGLEFKYVFIVGLEEGILPHINSMLSNSELEEERRLCYVALTRAKDELYLVNARERMLYGKVSINQPSRFISEINDDLIESLSKVEKQEKVIREEDIIREEEVDYQVNDLVYHETFGKGKVLEVDDKLVKVAFPHPYGVKTLMKNHKKLSKI